MACILRHAQSVRIDKIPYLDTSNFEVTQWNRLINVVNDLLVMASFLFLMLSSLIIVLSFCLPFAVLILFVIIVVVDITETLLPLQAWSSEKITEGFTGSDEVKSAKPVVVNCVNTADSRLTLADHLTPAPLVLHNTRSSTKSYATLYISSDVDMLRKSVQPVTA